MKWGHCVWWTSYATYEKFMFDLSINVFFIISLFLCYWIILEQISFELLYVTLFIPEIYYKNGFVLSRLFLCLIPFLVIIGVLGVCMHKKWTRNRGNNNSHYWGIIMIRWGSQFVEFVVTLTRKFVPTNL